MEATKLEGQWRSLAERFRRIANNDCSESEVRAAAAHGGRLIYETKAAGLLPNTELPPREPTERISDDDSPLMLGVWGIVDLWCSGGNPSHVRWENRDCGDAAESLRVGSTDKADWRIRAENYAAVCDALADETANHVGRAKLRAFGIAVQLVGQKLAAIDAESEPIIAEHRAEIDRLCADYRDVVQRIESEWAAEFGEPYPKQVEDWQRWAARVGWSGERIADGKWKPRDLFPIIEGYLQRLRDQSGSTNGQGDEAADDPRPTATINERMKAELASNLETVKGWTARQWANHLDCSVSSIGDAQTWKDLELLRKNTKAEKAMDRHRKSKPVKRR